MLKYFIFVFLQDYLNLYANIFFPNLEFSTRRVDFGCILNNTEMTQTLTMTNNSPLHIRYTWSFLKKPPVRRDPLHDDEGVDMQSECETDSLEEEEDTSTTSLHQQEEEEEEESSKTSPAKEGELLSPDKLLTDNVGVTINIISASSDRHSPSTQHEEQMEQLHLPPTLPLLVEEENENLPYVLSHSLPPSEPSESTVPEEEQSYEGDVAVTGPQPWEMVSDPFQPISIDQVMYILYTHTDMYNGHIDLSFLSILLHIQ